MSRLTDLLRQARQVDPQLGADLESEIAALTKRRTFGLVFERHQPEAVELPGRPVRRGDKVRVLPPRGSAEERISDCGVSSRSRRAGSAEWLIWRSWTRTSRRPRQCRLTISSWSPSSATPSTLASSPPAGRSAAATSRSTPSSTPRTTTRSRALLFTHRGKVDAIYIDPPYNTGAKDWKYNNDYVEGDDLYRHSKWLAFMERRLLLAKELLNPDDSVLIVTIDEKEYLRLGLLLEQTFPEAGIQMVSITDQPGSVARPDAFHAAMSTSSSSPSALPLRANTSRTGLDSARGRTHDGKDSMGSAQDGLEPTLLDRASPRLILPHLSDPVRPKIASIG